MATKNHKYGLLGPLGKSLNPKPLSLVSTKRPKPGASWGFDLVLMPFERVVPVAALAAVVVVVVLVVVVLVVVVVVLVK